MNLEKYFTNAMTYEKYVELLDEYRNLHDLHYRKFTPDENIVQADFLSRPFKILVITEPWCSDSLALLPLIRKLSKMANSWEMRIIRRDENPELMQQFLTDESRAIPVFLFMDEKYNIIARWGARPKAAQKIYDSYKMQIETGKISKEDVTRKIRTFYAKDRGKESLAELKELLEKV